MSDEKLTFDELEQRKEIQKLGQQLKGKSYTERNQFLIDEFHTAIRNNKLVIAEYLLDAGVDIDCQDIENVSPLLAALKSKQTDAVKWLLARGASVSAKNIYHFTTLHYAKIMNLDSEIEALLLQSGGEALLNEKNIYGKTAREYQTGFDANKTIHQRNIEERIKSYLAHHKRMNPLESEKGICCGLSFLFLIYARQGKEDYFFNTLKLISEWDGSEQGLHQTFPETMPQSKYYNNLDELLTQWINDIVVFQKGLPSLEMIETRAVWKDQLRRLEQYELAREKNWEGTIQFLHQWSPENPNKASKFQIRELLEVFQNMPVGTCLEIGGGGHAISMYINKDHQMVYYDSLLIDKIPPTNNINNLLELIMNTKYQGLRVSPSDPGGFIYQFHYFSQDEHNFKDYDVKQFKTTLNAIHDREFKAKTIGMLILGGVGAALGIGIITAAILIPMSLPLLLTIPIAASLALITTGIGIWMGWKISPWINRIVEQHSLDLKEKVTVEDIPEIRGSYHTFKALGPSTKEDSPTPIKEEVPLVPESGRTIEDKASFMGAPETSERSGYNKP